MLICLQHLSWPHVGYPALPLARQLAHQRCVLPNPLVLGKEPLKSPAPTTDRDRPVSRRSKPSSRTAFIGEQPNPWDLLQPQDAMSRHRTDFPRFRDGVDYVFFLLSILGSENHDLTLLKQESACCLVLLSNCQAFPFGSVVTGSTTDVATSHGVAGQSQEVQLRIFLDSLIADGFAVISRFVGRESLPQHPNVKVPNLLAAVNAQRR